MDSILRYAYFERRCPACGGSYALTMLDTQIEAVQRNLAVGIPVAQLADVDGAAHRITRNGTSVRTTAAMNTTSARPTVIGAIWGISSR